MPLDDSPPDPLGVVILTVLVIAVLWRLGGVL